MTTNEILKRFDELVKLGNEVLLTKKRSGDYWVVNYSKYIGFRTASISFLERIFEKDHSYCEAFALHVNKSDTVYNLGCIEIGISILQTAKNEIEGGWLSTIEGQISAEIFADFIALAKKALDDNKDVAAVLACAALEDALKRLATKENLDVSDKDMSDVINALKAKGIIKGVQVPIVQSYVKLRNKAFHAEWDKIDKESVSSVIGFTEQFLLTNFS
jgi:uncharacterized protein YutE (UPF0331/DUF86 family)